MPEYYTIVDGMVGTGNPIVPEGAVSTDQSRPQDMTGGAFTGMQVDERVKAAIEAGSGADFFYFTEKGQGVYDMRPRLPEYGAISETGPVFKVRENNNWLAKGMARQFLNDRGQVDLRKGREFLAELEARFPIYSENAVDPNDLTLSADEVRAQSGAWLCDRFQIPSEAREDFITFFQSVTSDELKVFHRGNFVELWSKWANNAVAFEEMAGDETSEFNSPEFQGEGREVREQAFLKYEQTVKEIQRLAAMDPEKEMDMVVPTECIGSAHSNRILWDLANNARSQMGERTFKRTGEPAFQVSLKKELGETQQGELKWDEHFAPVLGSFELDGKTYFLTAEAFAPESDTFTEHPGMTFGTAVGIYSGPQDFVNYYKKDTSFISDEYSRKMVSMKQEGSKKEEDLYDELIQKNEAVAQEREDFRRRFDDNSAKKTRDAIEYEYTGIPWEERYLAHQEDPASRYTPVMGVHLGGVANDLEIEARIRQREALMIKDRIPEEYQEIYGAMMEQYASLNQRINALRLKDHRYEHIQEVNEKKEDFLRVQEDTGKSAMNQVEKAIDGIEKELEDLTPARLATGSFLEAIISGRREFAGVGAMEMESLNRILEGTGFTAEGMRAAAEDKSWELLAMSKVRMEIQAGTGKAAEDFLRGTVGHMTEVHPRSREFAVQNFDVAFGKVFTKEGQRELARQGKDLFDHIYIDGVSARERYEERYDQKYGQYPPHLKDEFIKCDIMRDILDGKVVETVPVDGNGLLPLSVSTNVPELKAKVLVSEKKQIAFGGDFREQIERHKKELEARVLRREESGPERRETDPQAKQRGPQGQPEQSEQRRSEPRINESRQPEPQPNRPSGPERRGPRVQPEGAGQPRQPEQRRPQPQTNGPRQPEERRQEPQVNGPRQPEERRQDPQPNGPRQPEERRQEPQANEPRQPEERRQDPQANEPRQQEQRRQDPQPSEPRQPEQSEPQHQPEERQGQRLTMSQLLDQLENQKNPWYHINSKSYKEVMAALKAVNELTLDKPSADSLKNLQAAYGRLGEACDRYLEEKGPRQSTKLGQERFALVNQLKEYQRQDTEALGNVNTQRISGQANWLETIEGARTRRIDVRGQQLETVGAVTSSRLKVELDGKKGFFTSETRKLSRAEQIRQAAAGVTDPKARNYFMSLADGGLMDVSIHPDMWENNPQRVEQTYEQWKRSLPQPDGSLAESGNFDLSVRQFFEGYARTRAANSMPESGKVVDGTRMDTRNVGMSRIAQLLGKPNLIAHSTMMEIETDQGVQKGVFMEFAKGHDYSHEDKDPVFSSPINYETGAAKSQMADLQVLDLICGNVDRHSRNIFYDIREDENHQLYLAGIQGIDNDTSFGLLNAEDLEFKKDQLTGYTGLTCMNADTASAVMSLDKPALEYALKDILSQEEIEAAWSRTQGLQEVIRQSALRQKAPETGEAHVKLVYDNSQWEKMYFSRPDPANPSKKQAGPLVGDNYFKNLNQMQEGNASRVAKRQEAERARSRQFREDQAHIHETAAREKDTKRAQEAPTKKNPLSFDQLSKKLGAGKETPVTRRDRSQVPSARQDTKGKRR